MSIAAAHGDVSSSLTRHPFSFKGDSGTYFGICLRTVLLAIVTLGIYDAWGTVERRRYRMGNTIVAGHGFDYHANPVVILVGRFIAIGVIIGLQILLNFSPPGIALFIGPVVFLLFILALPYVVLRSLRFHLRNTSYRNVRFDFSATYGSAFFAIVVVPLVVSFTLGLAYPWYLAKFQEFVFKNLRLGKAHFDVDVPLTPLFKAFAIMVLIAVPLTIAVAFGAEALIASEFQGGGPLFDPQTGNLDHNAILVFIAVVYTAVIFFFILMFFLSFIVKAALRNVVLRNLWLQGGHRFDSDVTPVRFGWIVVSRGILATISVGLLIPWATVQIHRYLMDHTALLANGDLDKFVSTDVDPGGAAASEFGAMEGIADGVFSGI